jgi:hypothetical protein
MYIKAIKQICRLLGGSQAQVMAADDGHEYAVKFQGNHHARLLGRRLARIVGLSVPEPLIIYVDAETIREYKMSFQLAGTQIAPTAGQHFGSRLIVDQELHDWLPSSWLGNIKNTREFAGMLAFDKWTGNADGRQVVFHKRHSQRKYTAAFIDFGYCFNAAEWSFPDSPFRGAYARQEVYAHIESWNDVEPWLSRIERCSKASLQSIARDIPIEWYGEPHDVDCLVDSLFERRSAIRRLIDEFRKSHRNPFPNWKLSPVAVTSSYQIGDLAAMISAPG